MADHQPLVKNKLDVVLNCISLAYSPKQNKGRGFVAHLHTPDATFAAPNTSPTCLTPLDYLDSHADSISVIADLQTVSYDMFFAKNGRVLLTYSAEGGHYGEAYNAMEPRGEKAKWSANAIFEVEGGKVKVFAKEWDNLNVWKQLRRIKGDRYASVKFST